MKETPSHQMYTNYRHINIPVDLILVAIAPRRSGHHDSNSVPSPLASSLRGVAPFLSSAYAMERSMYLFPLGMRHHKRNPSIVFGTFSNPVEQQ